MLFVIVLLAVFISWIILKSKKPQNLPPGPPKLPILGNLLQLDASRPHVTFHQWAREYGDVILVKVFNRDVIVVNSIGTMREALLKDGENFAGRLVFRGLNMARGGKYGYVTTEGPLWREQRRFALHVLRDFGLGRAMQEDKIALETSGLFRYIDGTQLKHGRVDLGIAFSYAVVNIISNMLFGERFDYDSEEFHFLDDSVKLLVETLQKLLILEVNPILRYVPPVSTNFAKLQAGVNDLNQFISKRVDQHSATYEEDLGENGGKSSDFTYAYLGEMKRRQKEEQEETTFTKEQLLSSLQDLLVAGYETTATTLTWTILYFVRHPEVQEKMYLEIVANAAGVPTWADRVKLPYCTAVVAEVQRLANIVPLGLFHRNFEPTTISGYNVPAGSLVITNLWSIMRDSRVFEQPAAFRPERFINEDSTITGMEGVVPFSIGKRACLGEGLARMELFMFATALVYRYRFTTVDGKLPNLEPKVGFVLAPRHTDVVATLRQ